MDAVTNTRAILAAADQTRLPQNSQVLGNGGLCQRQLANDLTAHPGFPVGQYSQDADPCRMADRFGEQSKFLVRLRPLHGAEIRLTFGFRNRAAERPNFGVLFHIRISSIDDLSVTPMPHLPSSTRANLA